MGYHVARVPAPQPVQQYTAQLFRILDTYGRTPPPPLASMVVTVNGTPVAWFTDDQAAAILLDHVERNGRG